MKPPVSPDHPVLAQVDPSAPKKSHNKSFASSILQHFYILSVLKSRAVSRDSSAFAKARYLNMITLGEQMDNVTDQAKDLAADMKEAAEDIKARSR